MIFHIEFETAFASGSTWTRSRPGDLECLLRYPNIGAGIRLECQITLLSDILVLVMQAYRSRHGPVVVGAGHFFFLLHYHLTVVLDGCSLRIGEKKKKKFIKIRQKLTEWHQFIFQWFHA